MGRRREKPTTRALRVFDSNGIEYKKRKKERTHGHEQRQHKTCTGNRGKVKEKKTR
jgi:hypothetical protein